jgi:hypothetical protein
MSRFGAAISEQEYKSSSALDERLLVPVRQANRVQTSPKGYVSITLQWIPQLSRLSSEFL